MVLRVEPDAPTLPFVCECGRPDCLKTVRLTIQEYEQAPKDPRCFLCITGQEIIGDNLGRVVRRTDKIVIVEKNRGHGRDSGTARPTLERVARGCKPWIA